MNLIDGTIQYNTIQYNCVFRKWREMVYLPWCRCHCMPFSPKMLKNLYRWPASRLDKQTKRSQFFTGSHGIASQERRFLRFLERLLGAYFHHSSIWGYRAMACLQIVRRLCNLQTFWPTFVLFWLFIYKSTSSRSPYSRFLAYNIFKAKMAPHIAHSGHITSSRHFLKTQLP